MNLNRTKCGVNGIGEGGLKSDGKNHLDCDITYFTENLRETYTTIRNYCTDGTKTHERRTSHRFFFNLYPSRFEFELTEID